VRSIAEGKNRMMIGVNGVARIVERTDPSVVRLVWRSVASTGGSSVPVKIFFRGVLAYEIRVNESTNK